MRNRVVLIRSNPVNPDPAVERVVSALVESGFYVTVLCWDRSEKYDACEVSDGDKIKFVRFGIPAVFSGGIKKNLLPMVEFQKKMKKWLKDHRDEYDVIHAFDMDTGLGAKAIAKRYNKKFVYHILDFYAACRFDDKSFLYKIVKKTEFSVINKADATIICTESRKIQLKGSNPKKLVVIHNTPGYTESSERFNGKLSEEKVKIVYVGCFENARLLKELVQCVMQDEHLELHIGGFGLYEEYIKEADKKCSRVVFYGKLGYDDVLSLEDNCDIMTAIYEPIVPNHRFVAPNKLYESMMLGKPVIMCKGTGWDDVVCDIGVLIESSFTGLKAGIEEIISKKEQWKEMGTNARKKYESDYSWDIMKERIKNLYIEL